MLRKKLSQRSIAAQNKMASKFQLDPDPNLNSELPGNLDRSTGITSTHKIFEFGVPSNRPELGTHSATALDSLEWKTCLRKNLGLCREAIDRNLYFSKKIQSTTTTQSNFMFVLESSLFDMATSGLAEGVMYAVVFESGRRKFVRFMESGVFDGFFENRGLDIIKEAVGCIDETDFFWEKIFTKDDLQLSDNIYQSNLTEKRKSLNESTSRKLPKTGRRYKNLLIENQTSVKKSLQSFLLHVQATIFTEKDLVCRGVLVNVERKKSYKDQDNSSYYSANKCFDREEFLSSISVHREQGIPDDLEQPQFLGKLHGPLPFNQQLKYLSCMSNLHKWQYKSVNYSQWLPLMDEKGKYKPASPRNSIIYHFNEGCLDLVYNVVLKLRNQMRQSQQTSSTFVNNMSNDDSILADIPSAPKRRRHEHAKRLTMDDLMANIRILDPQFSADNMAHHLSKYETFKFAMIENGKLFWRHSSSNLDIFSLNDVNQSTGVFQEDCYVHLTRSKIDGGHSELSSTCSIYSTLIQLANLRITEEELDGMDISAVQCCHMRLFNDMIQSNLPSILNNTSNSENLLIKDLESSKHLINESICQLPTPSNRSLKFSVYSDHDDSCNFVHITDNKVCCQSG